MPFWKLFDFVRKWLRGGKLSSADRELPFGPYLSMGALAAGSELALVLARLGKRSVRNVGWLFWHLLGVNVPFPN